MMSLDVGIEVTGVTEGFAANGAYDVTYVLVDGQIVRLHGTLLRKPFAAFFTLKWFELLMNG